MGDATDAVGHERVLQLVRAAVASSDDPVEAVRRLMHDYAVGHAMEHTGARIVNYELTALSPEHFAEIRGIRQQINETLDALIERGLAIGAFGIPDPRMTMLALLSLGIDIARWYREDGRWSPEDVGTRYAEMAVRIVGSRDGVEPRDLTSRPLPANDKGSGHPTAAGGPGISACQACPHLGEGSPRWGQASAATWARYTRSGSGSGVSRRSSSA